MGILELLTLVFVVLKLIGTIDWSWFFVLLPIMISFTGYILWFLVVGIFIGGTARSINRKYKRK